jgi:radical SAM superfamily enzyme YgiQ (UPF0313 family)
LVVYDNDSYIHWFPQGLAYVAAILLKNGHEVEIYSQDVHHYPEEHLTGKLDKDKFDVIGVSVVGGYYQYRKLLKISAAINKAKNRPFFIIGGHGPSPEPEFFLKKTKADAAVIGEGEITVIELLDALANRKSLSGIKGIAFRSGDEVQVNERRDPIKDIDTIPFPAYRLFPISYYRLFRMPHVNNSDFVMTVLSSRGCTFQCNFCYRMDKGFRARRNECIVDEISLLKRDFGITYITFGDELLMSSIERTISLCEAFLKAKLNIRWDCNGRLNYAKPEVLKIMKKSGCTFINYGIESMDDLVLKNMKKGLTAELIVKGIEATSKSGISQGFNIIFGNIGENKETLDKGVEFLLKYDNGAQLRTIRPVTPYPGSPLYYHAIKKGLLRDCEDFYENKHVNSDLLAVNFTDMTDDEYYEALYEANKRLLENYCHNREHKMIEEAKDLYFNKNRDFRGFRQS